MALVLVIFLLLLASPRIRCLRTGCLLGAFHEYELLRVRVVISTELRSSEGDEELVKRGI